MNYHSATEGWTIAEILEHVTLTSHFLLLVIRHSTAKALKRAQTRPIPEGESNLENMTPVGHPDAFPWLRPDHMEPTGTKTSVEIQTKLREQKSECLALLEQMANGEGALVTVRMTVQELGKIDLYQWLYFLALHAQRHLVEIERIHTEFEQQA